MEIRNFCIVAHVDHGKSTLADRLLELTGSVAVGQHEPQLLDRNPISRERGITIKLAPVTMTWRPQTLNSKSQILNKSKTQNSNVEFRVSDLEFADSEYLLNLIDTPGHVDFSYEVSRSLAAVEGAVLLVDATQGIQAQTLAHLEIAREQKLTIIPVVNKIDVESADVEGTTKELSELVGHKPADVLCLSAKTGEGVGELIEAIIERIPGPGGQVSQPFQALIFDSVYDDHRGVVAFIKVVNGVIRAGDPVELLATKTRCSVVEVGMFELKLTRGPELRAGQIGYLITGLKDIRAVRPGDTVGVAGVGPLPGYRKARPLVFATLYPTSQGAYEKLRMSLEKLALQDGALLLQPESHPAFGRGIRAGVLGLLHLDIVRERLEREFNLSTIVATPQVELRETSSGSRTVIEEPWVKLEIISPAEHQSRIYDLLKEYRAAALESRPVGARLLLIFEAPLLEVITDLHDQLKSVSRGFASLSYELIGFREGDLVPLGIHLNGELHPAFHQVVHRTKLDRRARALVSKLRDLIPRQLVEVRIQAVVGGKVMASARIPPLRKDVIAKLYGGDYTRKSKLLKKQAAGKKKMFTVSKVSLPPDVFLKAFQA